MSGQPTGPSWATFMVCMTGAVLAGAFFVVWVGPTHTEKSTETSRTAGPGDAAASDSLLRSDVSARETDQKRSPRARFGDRPSASRVPVALAIPTIGVDTRIVHLGLLRDRTVEVPAEPMEAGWFGRGPAPGQPGSSVILGHVDSEDGPAVFARLHELQRGDPVRVRSKTGRTLRFVVMGSKTYPNAEFPATRVYGRTGARRLNLVTCAGTFNQERGSYQENLVVYTRRAATKPPSGR